MRLILLVLLLLPVICCISSLIDIIFGKGDSEITTEFPKFLSRFRKRYSAGSSEGKTRLKSFTKNYKKIKELQKQGVHVEVNGLADLTDEERAALTIPLSTFPLLAGEVEEQVDADDLTVPASSQQERSKRETLPQVDLRTDRCMGPVKNQGSECGSCYSFATIHAVEFQHCRFNGTLESFAEQDIIDCARPPRVKGCVGGYPKDALIYLNKNGVASTSDCPYEGVMHSVCPTTLKRDAVVRKACSLKGTAKKNVGDIEHFVSNYGPMMVVFRFPADDTFYFLANGSIWEPTNAACNKAKSAHAVTIVGYGSENGKDYWLIRNTWGTGWSDSGYGKIIKGKNACKIEKIQVDFPLVYGNEDFPNEKKLCVK